MKKVRVSNIDEYLADMDAYALKVKNMSKEDSKKALIRIGVLSSDGQPKKQICTGAYSSKI